MEHIIAYEGHVKVSLGLMQESYVPLFVPWINKRAGVEGTLQRPPYSHAVGIEWVRGLDKSKGKDEVFAVLLQSSNPIDYTYVGHMGIHGISWPHGFAHTGSIIGAESARGHGCGTEAKLLVLYHAFKILGLRKLTSTVKVFNAQSLGHLIKCGYQVVGRYHRHHLHEGEFIGEIILEVFEDDWQLIWDRYQKTKKLPQLTDKQRKLVARETRM